MKKVGPKTDEIRPGHFHYWAEPLSEPSQHVCFLASTNSYPPIDLTTSSHQDMPEADKAQDGG